jgi:hypothetical protein
MDKTIKVRWSTKKASFSLGELESIFGTFGKISHLILSSKKPSAMIEFQSILSAVSFIQYENNRDI